MFVKHRGSLPSFSLCSLQRMPEDRVLGHRGELGQAVVLGKADPIARCQVFSGQKVLALAFKDCKAECVPILATRHTLCQLGGELPAASTHWGQEQHQLRSPQPTQQRYVGVASAVPLHICQTLQPHLPAGLSEKSNKQSSCHDTHFTDGESRPEW